MKSLAVITARGGSKRIPRKNIRDFNGKPIIAYAIQTALQSHCFDEVMVSTEDEEIAAVAEKFGAHVPFLRSLQTSHDLATTAEVLLEVLCHYAKAGKTPEFLCCIYPTTPLLTSEYINSGFKKLCDRVDLATVMSIVRFSHPVQRALRLQEDLVSMNSPEYQLTRTQDLEPMYYDAGQFYWIRVEAFIATQTLIGAATSGIIIPEERIHDIDNESDWILAEQKYSFLQTAQNQK